MKEKILAAIKAKFPAINLSKKRLEQIATVIESKVIDDETKVDAALTLYNEYNPLAEMASHDDKLRTAEKKLKETTQTPKDDSKKDEKIEPADAPDDAPAWAKAILDSNKKLAESVATLQAEKAQTTIQSQLKEKLKDVNPLVNWADWKQPETDEDATAFIEKVTAKSKEVEKTLTEKGLSALSAPKNGTQTTNATAVSASLKQTLEQQNKTKQAETATAAGAKPFVINTPGTL